MDSPRATNWTIVDDDAVLEWSGMLGKIVTRTVVVEQVAALDESLGFANTQGPVAHKAWGMEDLCPDPLIFALGSGLPRIRLLATQIDGGSEWENWAPIGSGPVTLVSQISAIHHKQSATGKRMMRTTYEVTGYSARGARLGVARGFSLDVAASAGGSA
jgi:hypothetical protein